MSCGFCFARQDTGVQFLWPLDSLFSFRLYSEDSSVIGIGFFICARLTFFSVILASLESYVGFTFLVCWLVFGEAFLPDFKVLLL
jgi:hypothetical protein